jgi:hypothetical protein
MNLWMTESSQCHAACPGLPTPAVCSKYNEVITSNTLYFPEILYIRLRFLYFFKCPKFGSQRLKRPWISLRYSFVKKQLPWGKLWRRKPGAQAPLHFHKLSHLRVSRDSVVGLATRYEVDGQGIESRWGARFSAPVETGPGAHPASCTMCTGSFLGVKRSGRGVDHPPPCSAEVKERVELYLYSPSGTSWPVLG